MGHFLLDISLLLSLASIQADPVGIPMNIPFIPVPSSPFIHSPVFSNLPKEPQQASHVRQAPAGSSYCLTKGCVNAASDMIRSMDETADPCTDFYQFSCGGFIKETVIPEHKTSMSSFSTVRDKLNERLLKLFNGETKVNGPDIYDSVRNLYQSCINEEQIEASSKDELKELLATLGGWPVVEGDKWIEDGFKWYILAQKSEAVGFSSDRLLSMSIGTDAKDSTKRMLSLDQPSLGLSREYLIKGAEDKDVQAYYQYMVDTAVWMGASPEVAAKEMKDVLEFELILANMTLPREERRNKTALYNPMTIEEGSKIYPDLPWVNHINKILNNPEITVDKTEIVNVAVPKYVREFKDMIKTIPDRIQANYMIWRNVKFAMGYLGSEANEIKLKYEKVISGKASKSPRWEKCVKSTAGLDGTYFYYYEGSLSNAIGSMFVKKYFAGPAKDMADNMVTNIMREFKVMLDELTWMDQDTKRDAHRKADLITPHIAYPKEILNNQLLDDFYKGLVLQKEGYLKNIITLNKFINAYYVSQLRTPIDKQSWKTHGGAAVVNAFYSSAENSIQFPAGILDGVFFGADRPLYMNYGAIGLVIGHEITHGFDDQGSQKDGHGNLVNWWKPKAKANYLKKTQCVIDQYGNYTVEVDGETLNIDGFNTQGENIADMGGAKEAFRAYNKLVELNGPEPLLPGLNYSQRQLFWLSSAQAWCNVMRPATLKNRVLTDPHSPGNFRVNGPFANMPEFSQDWGCPLRSKMNPVKKCVVW